MCTIPCYMSVSVLKWPIIFQLIIAFCLQAWRRLEVVGNHLELLKSFPSHFRFIVLQHSPNRYPVCALFLHEGILGTPHLLQVSAVFCLPHPTPTTTPSSQEGSTSPTSWYVCSHTTGYTQQAFHFPLSSPLHLAYVQSYWLHETTNGQM